MCRLATQAPDNATQPSRCRVLRRLAKKCTSGEVAERGGACGKRPTHRPHGSWRSLWGAVQATDVPTRARRGSAPASPGCHRRAATGGRQDTSLRAPERRDGAKVIFRRVSFFATRTVTNGADGRTGPDLLRSLVRLASTLYAVPIASGTPKGPSSPSERPVAPSRRPSSSGSPVPPPALPSAAPTTLLRIALDRLGLR